MRIGIDGLPLTEDLTGVGHYTLGSQTIWRKLCLPMKFIWSHPGHPARSPGSENNRRTCGSSVLVLVRFLGIGGPSGCRATFAASASIFFMEPTLKCPCGEYVLPW